MENEKSRKIAIYTRKSKYSDKSESIDSQIEYCKKAARARYPDASSYSVYVDEGFSGGNTERPQFKKLLADLGGDGFMAVICYKIDRISRSLVDFANLQEYLKSLDINIISASEGFDTSTPWGQAVLNILMIFAQLERGNVSERVKDTMLHYGRQGRWTGGAAPTGFKSVSQPYIDAFGHEKRMTILSPVEKEVETVSLIYEKYKELRSLGAVARWLSENEVPTKNAKQFSAATVRDILINPVYASADKELFRYFSEKGAELCGMEGDYNGVYSVLPYNREDKKKLTLRPVSEWIIAVSRHRGIITGSDWVKIQRSLEANSARKPRLGTAGTGVFSGLITCSVCGSVMRVKRGGKREDGSPKFYYVCRLKEVSRRTRCRVGNIAGHEAERHLLEQMEEFASENGLYNARIKKSAVKISCSTNRSHEMLEKCIGSVKNKELQIKNLLSQASQMPGSSAGKFFVEKIEELDADILELNKKISALEISFTDAMPELSNYPLLKESLSRICGGFDITTDAKELRSYIKLLIERIDWDGSKLTVYFRTGEADF